ncbi:hypothetical protein BDV12DRAFT_170586 [Aspergillus spectabilis]
MSKRSAQGPQGDKDSNLFQFNMNSTPDDKPQRATAAQLASRKIREARRRPRATGSPSSSSAASFGGPFSSIDPNTVSSPSAGQQPMTNGFSFGQSQSFPPASPAPQPQAQNGGSPFAFGSGGNPSGFNFSASFGGPASTPASNPFASVNTGGASQQPTGGSFSGFKGNLFNVPSTQSPAQQPLPSGGFFGAGAQQSGSTGGLFGSTASSGPSQFGVSAPTNGNPFSQSSTNAPSTNVFAQSGVDKPIFAQSTAFGNDSMQTSPDSKSPVQKLFPSGSGGFGSSTNFGGAGTSNLFGGTTTAPAQTPSTPLFGAKPSDQAPPTTTSLFGGTTQPTSSSSAPLSSSATLTSSTGSPSLFSTQTPKPAAANPFQSANLFGAPTPSAEQKPSEEKAKEEAKPSQPSLSQPSFGFPSTTSGSSLFSKSETASPAQSSGTASTPSLFAPKPTPTEQDTSKPSGGNPFSNLFVPKPVAAEKPKTEQKPLPSPNLFAPKPTSSEGTKTSEPPKAITPTSPFSAPTPAKPPTPAPQPQSPGFSISNSAATTSAPAFTPSTTSQSPFKINGAKPAATAPPALSTPSAPTPSFDKLLPAKMPSGLEKNTKEEVETVYRVRLLNECFQREVARLNPTTESFDTLVQFFLRIRETIGAPVEGAGTKRKASIDSDKTTDAQPSKKVRPFGSVGNSTPSVPSPSNTTTPSKLIDASQSTPATSNKRKATEDNDSDTSSAPHSAKRASGDSTTASIFANSFSRSKTSESDEPPADPSPKKLEASSFKPSTPDAAKPALFSTTPTTSPSKPLFTPSASTKETSTSSATPAQPPSTFKPTSTASASSTSPANPFVLKSSGDSSAGSAAPPLAIPKFGSGSTNFFAQFKAQSEKNAEKEKEKRKAEDFDSDEDDEAEWERKDAEKQRKKREEIEAQKNRRAKFIPGQGFSFEEENATTDEEKTDPSPASSVASGSIFDSKPNSFEKSSNIFGHLSATPSESGDQEHDDADDTEEASVSGDDAAKDSEASAVGSKSNGIIKSTTSESSDEGDFTKALKKSKQVDSSQEQGSGGRSLFDRVQYDDEGKPKRQDEGDKAISSILGSSKYASSFSSSASTPNPFAASSQPQAENTDGTSTSKPAPTNIFGSSTPTSNIFGASTPAASGTNTPSIFATGTSATKPGTDNTWKLNTPIKFAPSNSTSKSEPEPAASASDSSKPFSTLFGAPAAGSKSGSGASGTLGFSFGGPSQTGSSLLTPTVLTSATPSRASTPGVTSDTGAESTDGDAAESLPQADLRTGAGEENEDVVLEAKTRALKIINGTWETQGLGFLRILKDRTTSRTRVLVRADPSGKVILNASLMKAIKYTLNGTSVQFLVPQAEGPPEQWALRVKAGTEDRLASTMEENKV